jgi:error-prone DNA polymerase
MPYTELHCLSCFSFLRGASRPEELVAQAAANGYAGLAITDECSLAGVVKAHVAAKEHGLQLIIGSEFHLTEGIRLVALAPTRAAYGELSGLISLGRRRSPKGEYQLALRDVIFHLKRCLLIWLPRDDSDSSRGYGRQLARLCRDRVWIGVHYLLGNDELRRYRACNQLGRDLRPATGGLRRRADALRRAQAPARRDERPAPQLQRRRARAAGACPTPSSTCAAWRS